MNKQDMNQTEDILEKNRLHRKQIRQRVDRKVNRQNIKWIEKKTEREQRELNKTENALDKNRNYSGAK